MLAQSVIWITAVMAVMVTGVLRRWGDATYLLFSVSVAAPTVVLPLALSQSRPDRGRPWHRCYWFKLNAWVAVVVGFGTYFGTHYFFDLMGMRYAFGARWTFDSHVLGHSGQRVPVFIYPLTHAYFMTYFAFLLAAERAAVARFRMGLFARTALVLALAYAVAFAETFFMASDLLSDLFAYENRGRMLLVGSFGYASYFIVGLPMVRRIDSKGEVWTIDRVILEALSTSMMILLLLEAWAKLVGRL
jgi:cycloeucalenol cycloisomerase